MTTKIESGEQWACLATISDDTRNLLIIWAKLQDVESEFIDLVGKVWGECQVDSMVDKFTEHICHAQSELMDLLPQMICDNWNLCFTSSKPEI